VNEDPIRSLILRQCFLVLGFVEPTARDTPCAFGHLVKLADIIYVAVYGDQFEAIESKRIRAFEAAKGLSYESHEALVGAFESGRDPTIEKVVFGVAGPGNAVAERGPVVQPLERKGG
jgi:hypothetical protein